MSKSFLVQVEISFERLEEMLEELQADPDDHSEELMSFIKKASDFLDIQQCQDLHFFLGQILKKDAVLLSKKESTNEETYHD